MLLCDTLKCNKTKTKHTQNMKNIPLISFAIVMTFFLVSCEEFFDPDEGSYVHFQIVNSSHDIIEYSFFTYKQDKIFCRRIGGDPISPSDTLHGGFICDNGREDNSWVDYFNTEKIDSFYVVISATPIEAKEGQKYDALPKGSNVLKIYKYTKESFYDFNPETDVVTFVYP